MYPLGRVLVQRAVQAGQLRPDFEPQDVPLIQMMLATVMDATRAFEPELWRRYFAIVLRGSAGLDAGVGSPPEALRWLAPAPQHRTVLMSRQSGPSRDGRIGRGIVGARAG